MGFEECEGKGCVWERVLGVRIERGGLRTSELLVMYSTTADDSDIENNRLENNNGKTRGWFGGWRCPSLISGESERQIRSATRKTRGQELRNEIMKVE